MSLLKRLLGGHHEAYRHGSSHHGDRHGGSRYPPQQTTLSDPGVVCVGCGAVNSHGSRFCNGCGKGIICNRCGDRAQSGARFCAQCGNTL